MYDWFVPMLLHRQGADHLRLRGLVQKAFTPRVINRMRPYIRDTAAALAERLQDELRHKRTIQGRDRWNR